MRIVFVVENYYPGDAGVPVVTRYLSEGLKTLYNYEVFAVTKLNNNSSYENHNGIKIYRFDVSYSKGFSIVGDAIGFCSKVIELDPDVLILECAQCVTTDIMLPHLHELKCKKILHSHDFSGLWIPFFKIYPSIKSTIASPKNHLVWKKYYRTFFKKYVNDFDLLLYLTDLGKDKEYFDKYSKVRYEILNNAADEMFFEQNQFDSKTKESLSGSCNVINKYCDIKSERYIICLSNYGKIKNQKTVLKEYYKASCPDTAMIFVGSTENNYYHSLKEMVKKLEKRYGKREVHFLTKIDRNDIPSILSHAEISVSASTWEAYSIALIEAMAVGTPFISTDVGNARLLPGGVTIKKSSDMHRVINELLNNREWMNKLSNKGRQYAYDNCRKDNSIKKLNRLICDLLAR